MKFIRNLLTALGKPEIIDLCEWPGAHQKPVMEFLAATFKAKPLAHWMEWLATLDICYGPVNTLPEAIADPNLLKRGAIVVGRRRPQALRAGRALQGRAVAAALSRAAARRAHRGGAGALAERGEFLEQTTRSASATRSSAGRDGSAMIARVSRASASCCHAEPQPRSAPPAAPQSTGTITFVGESRRDRRSSSASCMTAGSAGYAQARAICLARRIPTMVATCGPAAAREYEPEDRDVPRFERRKHFYERCGRAMPGGSQDRALLVAHVALAEGRCRLQGRRGAGRHASPDNIDHRWSMTMQRRVIWSPWPLSSRLSPRVALAAGHVGRHLRLRDRAWERSRWHRPVRHPTLTINGADCRIDAEGVPDRRAHPLQGRRPTATSSTSPS